MTYARLLGHEVGSIILVNLHHTLNSDLVSEATLKGALVNLHAELAVLTTAPHPNKIRLAFRRGLFAAPTRFQVRGKEVPRKSIKISAVVAFDKIRAILEKIAQRASRYSARIDAMLEPDAKDTTVSKAADLINAVAPRMPDLTLSDWGTIFWAVPSTEVARIQARSSSSTDALPSTEARQLRNELGLVHIDAVGNDPDRHIFVFEGKVSLSHLERDDRLLFRCARPTTLDGWDNRRFCQPMLSVPKVSGCGLTVDLANGTFGPGAAELVSTPLAIRHFECRYVGPLDAVDDGSDASYLDLLAEGGDLSAMAAELDGAAAS